MNEDHTMPDSIDSTCSEWANAHRQEKTGCCLGTGEGGMRLTLKECGDFWV